MIKQIALIFLILSFQPVTGQIMESFSDGDYTNGVLWTGSSSAWQVVTSSDVSAGATGSNTLRLSVAAGGGLKYLSTQIPGSWGAIQSWSCWIGRRGQAATSSNISYIWLYASEADISSATIDGYRIRYGDDATAGDRVVLESVANGVITTVISSSGTTPNGITDFGFLLRVTRTASGQWSLYTSVLPTASGSGATATTVPDESTAGILQASGTHTVFTDFSNGYVAFAALHTTGTTARAGAEFDQLLLRFASGSPLPARFTGFSCMESNDGVVVSWTNLTEEDVLRYVIESSSTGEQFDGAGEVLPLKNNGGAVSYRFSHNQALTGDRYYRVRAEETSGKIYYTSVLRISNSNTSAGIRLFPNPVQGSGFAVYLSVLKKGQYKFILFDGSGLVRKTFDINHPGGSWSKVIELNAFSKGTYYLRMEGPVILVKMFVVQ